MKNKKFRFKYIYRFVLRNQKNFIEIKKQLSPSPRITVSQNESCKINR